MEYNNHRVTIIDIIDGKRISQFGKFGSGQLKFQYPLGMTVLPDGNIVVADRDYYRLQVLTLEKCLCVCWVQEICSLTIHGMWQLIKMEKSSLLIVQIIVSRSSILTLPTCVALEERNSTRRIQHSMIWYSFRC